MTTSDPPAVPTAGSASSPSQPVTGHEWLARFAAEIGVDVPDPATIDVLLDLAGVAAHASERVAAPIACYLVGRAGLDPTAALDAARLLQATLPPVGGLDAGA